MKKTKKQVMFNAEELIDVANDFKNWPRYSTVIDPSEHDIEEMMITMIKSANKNKKSYYEMDIGKIYGLYLAWKELNKNI